MPLNLYRRHTEECLATLEKRFGKDHLTHHFLAAYKRCDCPIWMRGRSRSGAKVREACKTRDWEQAGPVAAERFEGRPQAAPALITLTESLDRWLNEKESHSESTQRKYRFNAQKFIDLMAKSKITRLSEVTVDHVITLRNLLRAQKRKAGTINNYRKILGIWFTYAEEMEWGGKDWKNPVKKVPRERGKARVTKPLDEEGDTQWRRLQAEIAPYLERRNQRNDESNWFGRATRTNSLNKKPEAFLALIELLYYTGLRISDAIRFNPSKIKKTPLGFSYATEQTKTHNRVVCFLEPWLAAKLKTLTPMSIQGYVFWDGAGDWEYYINSEIRKPMSNLGLKLGMEGDNVFHLHRLRDSFAINRLNEGVELHDLKDLLGHKSIKTTEQHYAPFVKSREIALERRLYAAKAAAAQMAFAPVIDISTRTAS
jgi:site-specific recombinase XerD